LSHRRNGVAVDVPEAGGDVGSKPGELSMARDQLEKSLHLHGTLSGAFLCAR
jgi:hypothetical protein